MYAQTAIKPNTLLRNGAYGIVMRGVQKCTRGCSSLRGRKRLPLCCIKLDTATDPACGAGATLIAGVNVIAGELVRNRPELRWQDHVVVAAQDIDYIVGLMCYIQLSLIGCAGFVKIGDSIADPMHFGDDMAKYWILPTHHQEIRRQLELDNAEMAEHQRKVG